MKNRNFLFYILFIFLLPGCREEYHPPLTATDKSFLVVEGNLNAGTGPTSIRLSQTTALTDAISLKPVDGAQLVVEGKDQQTFPLTSLPGGTYYAPFLGLTPGSEYRLLIRLPDGRRYESAFVEAKETPPIDSVSWQRDEKGVEITVSAHDPANNTRYYRWEYEETWEIRSPYFASYKYINGEVRPRDLVNDNVYYCWIHQPSTTLLLGSSTRLHADVISRKPLLQIPNASVKLSVRYSVLVRQYAIDQPGYEFLQAMKKNTESLGSIFDAQPSEVRGNIRSVSDPEETVIGYITASSVQEKRIFIDASEVPAWGYIFRCESIEVANHPDSFKKYYPNLLPYDARIEGLTILGYYSSDASCVDCTLRGSNKKPSFW